MSKSRTIQLVINGKDHVSKMLKRIGHSLKKWGVGALKITGGLVAGFGAVTVALGVMFKKLAGQIDEQAKMASALGLSNEQLGIMRDAAGYAGISISNLNTALRKMSQSVADAADGTGEAKDALEALGLDAKNLERMGPEKAFKAIISQLDKIPNGLKKTQMAMDIFGRSGASMTNLTSKGLQQAQKDAEDLGLKLSSAQAAHVESANDAWSRIKNVSADFLKFVTAKLAPGLKRGFDSAFEFIKRQDLKTWAVNSAIGIVKAFQGAILILGAVGEAVIAISRGLTTTFSAFNQFFGGLAVMTGNTKLADKAIQIQDSLDGVSRALEKSQGFSLSKGQANVLDELEKMASGLEKSKHELSALEQKAKVATKAMESLTARDWHINLTGIEKLNIGGRDMLEQFGNDLDDEADK